MTFPSCINIITEQCGLIGLFVCFIVLTETPEPAIRLDRMSKLILNVRLSWRQPRLKSGEEKMIFKRLNAIRPPRSSLKNTSQYDIFDDKIIFLLKRNNNKIIYSNSLYKLEGCSGWERYPPLE